MHNITLLALVVACFTTHLDAATVEDTLYLKVQEANTSDSLWRVVNVPLHVYTSKYDTIKNRTQLGILGHYAQQYFPDSVEILPSRQVPGEKGQPPKILKNFPLIDKSVIYMHAVAATQELSRRLAVLQEQFESVEMLEADWKTVFNHLQSRLSSEIDAQILARHELAELEKAEAAAAMELEVVRAEERRRIIELETEEQRRLKEFEEQLARSQIQEQFSLERARGNQRLIQERELMERREQLRQATDLAIQQEVLKSEMELEQLRQDAELNRTEEETNIRTQFEREREELELRKIAAQADEDKKKMIAMVQITAGYLSNFIHSLFFNPARLWTLVVAIIAIIGGSSVLREFAKMARQVLQRIINRPKLVRETSVKRYLLPRWLQAKPSPISLEEVQHAFEDVVMPSKDKERIIQTTLATCNAKRNGAPYRHVMLHGPPGTGKTMAAKRLAEISGLDYAVLSGGDVGPLGEDAVSEIHNLFRWARRSAKGLLVFIDEAEAFLGSRSRKKISENVINALNALLYHTGTSSTHFMLVIATNRPEQLDEAILDRIDESMHFALPGNKERRSLVEQYFNQLVLPVLQKSCRETVKWWQLLSSKQHNPARTPTYNITEIGEISLRLEGFSGREIARLMAAIQVFVVTNECVELSLKTLNPIVNSKVDEHMQKQQMIMKHE